MSNQATGQGNLKVIDTQALMAIVDGDMEFLQNIVEVFLDTYQSQILEIRDAISHSDTDKLYKSAHSLKGALGAIYAKAAFDAAMQLEVMGRTSNLDNAKLHLDNLEREIATLKPALTELSGVPI